MYNNLQPNPIYSLADLFKDIREGRTQDFNYNGIPFKAKKVGMRWEVTHIHTGLIATSQQYCNCMLDLQGMASCLIAEGRNLNFDKNGNFI